MKLFLIIIPLLIAGQAQASPSTLDVKKHGEESIRKIVEPVLNQYCHEQCQIIHIDTEVDLAVDDLTTPGFEETSGKATLAPASGTVRILMDDALGAQTRAKISDLLKEHLDILDYPVDIEMRVTKFPQPAASNYRVADLRDRVSREVKASIQNMLAQFCPDTCLLGDFDVQSEVINPEDINYSASQDFFQDGPAAIRVRGVKATIMTDQGMSPEQANGIVEMAKLKVAQYKNSSIVSQSMVFPKYAKNGVYGRNGMVGPYAYGNGLDIVNSDSKDTKDLRETTSSKEARELREAKESRDSKTENNSVKNNQTDRSTASEVNKTDTQANNNKQEKFEHYEKIERVENGDAVQQVLEKFRVYGIIFAAIVLALLLTLVAISFRKQIFETVNRGTENGKDSGRGNQSQSSNEASGKFANEDRSSLLSKRIESENLFQELTGIFSEQPKVAKHVFTNVLTEEGVETTAQYLEIFGESVVMDLLRDPGLQSDLTELMDFYSRNTFETSDTERLLLLKKLQHRTVTAKMQVHGSRSAALFDFLSDMDTPQIVEMVKNESNTVKAIVLTQCDSKKRQVIFNAHDENTRIKLMTELSRIDHLPKNYIHNVASALRRKKIENPKLNTEALPGTDVLVSFLEKSDISTQRTIVHQLMSSAGGDALQNLKAKLVSIETLRFIKDQQMTEVITSVKHEELVQFLKGCNADVRTAVLNKAPAELSADLVDGINLSEHVSREAYVAVERKVLNRMKVLANNGQINIAEVNERIFSEEFGFQNEREVTAVDFKRAG
jgi:flagellar motor switch protein FliG